MTEREISIIRKKFSTKPGGEFYKLFFTGQHYTPIEESIRTTERILQMLKIDLEQVNSFEERAIDDLVRQACGNLKSGCQKRKQPWNNCTLSRLNEKGLPAKSLALYGFTTDISKALQTIIDSEKRADNFRLIARNDKARMIQNFPRIQKLLDKKVG